MAWTKLNPRLSATQWRHFFERNTFELIVTVLLVVYFALDLTPSSYAIVLRGLGVSDTGLLFGQPSFLRSDEFAVWTPYTQAAVRNAFERINETSPYREDLRNFNALPLWDWGLLFKPQFWGFFLLPPDRAFSLYHTLLIGSSLIGWSLVFRLWGFPALWAAAASLLIFFSGHTQMAWTTWGPLMAIFPLLILAFCSHLRPLPKSLLLAWLMTIWLMSHFYPPVIISLGLAGVFLVAALTPRAAFDWRNIAAAAVAFLVACLLVRLYFGGVFETMAATVYPGQRSLSGGGLPLAQGLAHYFPFLTTRMDQSIIGANAYEVTTGSSYLPLAALAFLDWRNLARSVAESAELRWALCILLAGLLLFGVWMFVPIPASVGAFLLLDKVSPQRMMGASGLLLLALSMLLLQRGGTRFSVLRFLLMTVLVVGMWLAWKGGPSLSPQEAFANNGYWDLTILPALFLTVLLLWRHKDGLATAIILACVIVNVAGFGWINPLQSAKPIFAKVDSPMIQAYRHFQDRDPRHWTVVPDVPGAVLNGIGLRSISHVLLAPQLAFLRPYFPELSEDQFNFLFNRYARLELRPIDSPRLLAADAVAMPISRFLDGVDDAEMALPVMWDRSPPLTSEPGGYVDNIETSGNQVRLTGWAMLDPTDKENRIVIVADRAVSISRAASLFRQDVVTALGDPRLLRSGFKLEISHAQMHAVEEVQLADGRLDLVGSRDGLQGLRRHLCLRGLHPGPCQHGDGGQCRQRITG